jgi:hypothetical protein
MKKMFVLSTWVESTNLFNKETPATQSYTCGSTTASVHDKWGSGSEFDDTRGMFHKMTTTHSSLSSSDSIIILQVHNHCLSCELQEFVPLRINNLHDKPYRA